MGVLDRYTGAPCSDQLSVAAPRRGFVRVAASGTLGAGEAYRLEDAFNHELDEGAPAVLVDLRAVTGVDACVVHTLLRMVDQGHSATLEFRLSAPVRGLLEASGVSHHIIAGQGAPSLRPPPRGRRSRRQPLL